MSKTVLIQGYFYTKDGSEEKYTIFECEEVGKNQHYKTGAEFIKAVVKLYRDHGYIYTLTNVVIG